ncbi:translin-associated factor X-interacting protein 1 isoform X2 [Spodoptera frugiperda]|uniref:Translin-associated factor X-interacting protein 1 isoform X2 n=1 Tax=Spodoptera frugiperda TaxID=7108 RepID=A0A9R0CZH9_SPOFR|nr:translin-associated factor X-interacting protein 1 isoform X2 [Spodoptera frugiperda]
MSATGDIAPTVLVLDGGFSTQLSCHVGTSMDGDPLWSARFLQTHPDGVVNTHLDFLRAGSDVIMTNTYQASVGGFVKHLGISAEQGYDLIKHAVVLAKRARDIFLKECQETGDVIRAPLIAGSIGPYGAHLHDGSEYSGDYADVTAVDAMREWHKPRIQALVEAGVDILAFETIPCLKEAEMLVKMLKEYPKMKAWLSFSCKDEHSLAHGENFKMAAQKCWDLNPSQLLAIGVNCCSPKIVANLFKGINDERPHCPIPLITYPNSGEKYNPEIGWIDQGKCEALASFVPEWLDLGVRYVGGCCRTYATDISLINKQKVFGISARKKQHDMKMKALIKENEDLREQNLKLIFENNKLKRDLGKLSDDKFSDYLNLMRERDARYTLYFENLGLQMKLKELDGSSYPVDDAYGDPVVLRIALDKCRELLSNTQMELKKMTEEYADTVPRRDYDTCETKYYNLSKAFDKLEEEYKLLRHTNKRLKDAKASIEEELFDTKERCSELERAGTPRPQWELCADFIGGGRERWWQLARGLSSRDTLRVLLKELGPAAESDHLEHFDGLGMDPVIPPYLRYEGKVRNLRLSRREISVIINDIWLGKIDCQDMPMQDYVTKYFEDRYQQASVRAEWAYNVCAGAEQMLDEPQVKLFWGVLHGHLSERIYWGHRAHWLALKHNLYKRSKDQETISVEEFEKIAKSTFPLKSEVDIKNLMDVVRKQLKLKINSNDINLDKLFQENEEGFDRVEFARELFRQRQVAQDKYIREVVAELGGKHAASAVSVDNVKRAFAIVDPAIDHIRMERYIRWAFSDPTSDLNSIPPIPLRTLTSRLAAGDIERIGPRYRATQRRTYK